jgi:hypothetical protein
MMNRPNASLLYTALVAMATVGSFYIPFISVANGQPTQNNLMDLIAEFGGNNETDDENMMMMGNGMMGSEGTNMSSMPFNMGVFVMPMTCTSPNELIGLMSGMIGLANGTGETGGDNATQSMMKDMMRQQMMMPGKGMDGMDGMMGMMGGNRSEAEMEHIMNMQICFPMMGEKAMDGMMGMMG